MRLRDRLGRLGTLPFLAGAVVWLVLLRPLAFGGPASYVLVSGSSMEPWLHTGDLVVAVHEDDYALGDVVVFRADGGLVVHRIVGGDAEGFVVQGDNRGGPDVWRPTAATILGAVRLHAPGVGRALAIIRQPLVIGVVAGGLVALAVLGRGPRPGRVEPVR